MHQKISQQNLYDPSNEHDACGVGLLLNIQGKKSYKIIDNALQILENMIHRGAEGADTATGDGAGIMIQVPHEFILAQGIAAPKKGTYGTGLVFMPKDKKRQQDIIRTIKLSAEAEGLSLLAVRDVPADNSMLGSGALEAEPAIKQIFIAVATHASPLQLDVRLYRTRRRIEKECTETYVVSLSSKNMIYKGMLSSTQLRHYFPDLQNPALTSGIALVHSRFSTNTFPSWALAQPFRLLGHNGEINTIRGNRLWLLFSAA